MQLVDHAMTLSEEKLELMKLREVENEQPLAPAEANNSFITVE